MRVRACEQAIARWVLAIVALALALPVANARDALTGPETDSLTALLGTIEPRLRQFELRAAALAYARSMRFQPAEHRAGCKVAQEVEFVVQFQ